MRRAAAAAARGAILVVAVPFIALAILVVCTGAVACMGLSYLFDDR